MLYVRDLGKERKLEIYKKVKGICIWEGLSLMPTMKEVLNEKVKDVVPLIDYDMAMDYMSVYMDYSYGRAMV